MLQNFKNFQKERCIFIFGQRKWKDNYIFKSQRWSIGKDYPKVFKIVRRIEVDVVPIQ